MSESAEKQLAQGEAKRDDYVKQLRVKIAGDKKLRNFKFSDDFLIKYLRSRLYDVDLAFSAIQFYFNFIQQYPEFFKGVDCFKKCFECNFFTVLHDKRAKNGELVAFMRVGKWNPDQVAFNDLMASTLYGFELAELQEDVQKNGAIEIIDCANLTWKMFSKIGISEIKLACGATEAALPIRWKRLFLLNHGSLVSTLYNLAKPFLSRELKERVNFIGEDVSKIGDLIQADILPPEYGGTAKDVHAMNTFEYIKQNEGKLHELWKQFLPK